MVDRCIVCSEVVSRRQQSVRCQNCRQLQHRKCGNTGISMGEWRELRWSGEAYIWSCHGCQGPTNAADSSVASDLSVPAVPLDVTDVSLLHDDWAENRVELDDAIASDHEMSVDDTDNDVNMDDEDHQGVEALNGSFDIDRTIHEVVPIVERSIVENLNEEVPDDRDVTFEVVEMGTTRRNVKLLSSDGYSYTLKRSKEGWAYWYCPKRSKNFRCPATVSQRGDDFKRGGQPHRHAADPGLRQKVKCTVKVKQAATDQVFRPAANIVEEVVREKDAKDGPFMCNLDNLARIANRKRQGTRPEEPKDLQFEIDRDFINADEFLVADLTVDTARHIIMATDVQLQHLAQCRRWFMDGTFKVVKSPFYQLFSVHGFAKSGENVKQVPLAFVLMSRRTKQDYIEVLRRLMQALDEPEVEWCMIDFEAAMWQAVREVLPHVTVKGCVFHFTQRIYRKITIEGLSEAYKQQLEKYGYLRKLMSLPFLPQTHIEEAFEVLERQADQSRCEKVQEVVQYVRRTWIEGRVWTPKDWTIYRETVRTNNDVEGWHKRFNTTTNRADCSFYVLVPLLLTEARTVDVQLRLVSANLLRKRLRKQYVETHKCLEEYWDQYEEDAIRTSDLLRKISLITGLGAATNRADDANYEL